MAEGMLMFVRIDDPEEVRMETVGRPLSPDDEVRLVDDDDNKVRRAKSASFWRAARTHCAATLARRNTMRGHSLRTGSIAPGI